MSIHKNNNTVSAKKIFNCQNAFSVEKKSIKTVLVKLPLKSMIHAENISETMQELLVLVLNLITQNMYNNIYSIVFWDSQIYCHEGTATAMSFQVRIQDFAKGSGQAIYSCGP